jgi:hypothetical protein
MADALARAGRGIEQARIVAYARRESRGLFDGRLEGARAAWF